MTIKQTFRAGIFAAFWTTFMVWWHGHHSLSGAIVLGLIGAVIGFLFVWVAKRIAQTPPSAQH